MDNFCYIYLIIKYLLTADVVYIQGASLTN